VKKIKYLVFGLLVMFALAISVSASTTVQNKQELVDAIAAGETEIVLNADVTGVSSNIIVSGEGKNITIDGNGFEIKGTAAKMFEIHAIDGTDAGEDISTLTVTFKNVTIETSKTSGRAIDTRTGNISLVLDNATLKTTSVGNNQALTIGGNIPENITIELKNNSTIEAGKAGYGIIAFNPATIKITNSTVIGYAALYMKAGSEGSKITITNSTIEGKNDNNGYSDNFGTIAFETDNIELTATNSSIKATGSGAASQVIFGGRVNATTGKDNKITITGGEFAVKPEGYVATNDTLDITIGVGVSSNIDIPIEYLAENVEVVENNDGTVTVVEKHKITIAETSNGSVTVDKNTAIEGETIKVTVVPDKGYEVKNITANGNEVKDNKFIMPNKDVEVKVVFEKTSSSTNNQTNTNVNTNPKTGDEIYAYAIIGIISLLGLAITFKVKITD